MTTLCAIWIVDDETVPIDHFNEQQAGAGNGLSFKMPTWNGAAVKVAESTMKGGLKDGTQCEIKWACVCYSILVVYSNHSDSFQYSSRNYTSCR